MKKLFLCMFICTLFTISTTKAENTTGSHQILHPHEVNQLLQQINPQAMWVNLSTLTSFPDRSAHHQSGIDAEHWIQHQIETYIKNSNRHDVTLFTVASKEVDWMGNTHEYPQSSIVLKIGESNEPGIVLGAHFDTVACDDEGCKADPSGPLPGAGDDGSGTVTVLETARVLLFSNIRFKKPIYLIWYAAEEINLVGSTSVIADFKKRNVPIDAVMQLDMTGYAKDNDTTIWLSYDEDWTHTNKELTSYTLKLSEAYVKHPTKITTLSDESDHWSWDKAEYKTVFPMESNCHAQPECPRREHTNEDTIDKLSLDHMTDYLKLSIAFVAELAEPVNH